MTVTYYMLKHASDETKKVYIGSTDNIERRISKHKTNYNMQKTQLKLYNVAITGFYVGLRFAHLFQFELIDKS